mmetsp:Transcript_34688/g.58120  ORF Transcript_34688/g.58120 Transcript_34688/m.58120 type:complete len:111 (+) Transcript_34688:134-466(+)|eukprot:CAMPEP_0184653014 /NCGR_PEP_ID=MMETSP0308-20130426/10735_1 /TAXON_ID=38269 /ORGANISM="Gloeochaete witrockiana, Strain SAG 46.84" /LENGTH=110 /DNA_ID=CAMNT_0027088247 /DNA_START=110 /DNA_END=442 /DNA_ORIENTATION=+
MAGPDNRFDMPPTSLDEGAGVGQVEKPLPPTKQTYQRKTASKPQAKPARANTSKKRNEADRSDEGEDVIPIVDPPTREKSRRRDSNDSVVDHDKVPVVDPPPSAPVTIEA